MAARRLGAMPSASAISALVWPLGDEPSDRELASRQRAPRLLDRRPGRAPSAAAHPRGRRARGLAAAMRGLADLHGQAPRASANRFVRDQVLREVEPRPRRLPDPAASRPSPRRPPRAPVRATPVAPSASATRPATVVERRRGECRDRRRDASGTRRASARPRAGRPAAWYARTPVTTNGTNSARSSLAGRERQWRPRARRSPSPGLARQERRLGEAPARRQDHLDPSRCASPNASASPERPPAASTARPARSRRSRARSGPESVPRRQPRSAIAWRAAGRRRPSRPPPSRRSPSRGHHVGAVRLLDGVGVAQAASTSAGRPRGSPSIARHHRGVAVGRTRRWTRSPRSVAPRRRCRAIAATPPSTSPATSPGLRQLESAIDAAAPPASLAAARSAQWPPLVTGRDPARSGVDLDRSRRSTASSARPRRARGSGGSPRARSSQLDQAAEALAESTAHRPSPMLRDPGEHRAAAARATCRLDSASGGPGRLHRDARSPRWPRPRCRPRSRTRARSGR